MIKARNAGRATKCSCRIIGVAAKDGQFLWGYNKIANRVANIPTPIVDGDYIFTSTAYQTGSALLKLVTDGDGVKAEEVYWLDKDKFQKSPRHWTNSPERVRSA